MIKIRINFDQSGILRSIFAEGHSIKAGKGHNIVCAAVSSLLRSLVRTVKAESGCNSEVVADKDGFLDLRIKSCSRKEWFSGVADVVIAGLLEVEHDYPEECSINMDKMT